MTWNNDAPKIDKAKAYLKRPAQEIIIHFLWQDNKVAAKKVIRSYMLYLGLFPGTQTPQCSLKCKSGTNSNNRFCKCHLYLPWHCIIFFYKRNDI